MLPHAYPRRPTGPELIRRRYYAYRRLPRLSDSLWALIDSWNVWASEAQTREVRSVYGKCAMELRDTIG